MFSLISNIELGSAKSDKIFFHATALNVSMRKIRYTSTRSKKF